MDITGKDYKGYRIRVQDRSEWKPPYVPGFVAIANREVEGGDKYVVINLAQGHPSTDQQVVGTPQPDSLSAELQVAEAIDWLEGDSVVEVQPDLWELLDLNLIVRRLNVLTGPALDSRGQLCFELPAFFVGLVVDDYPPLPAGLRRIKPDTLLSFLFGGDDGRD